MQLLHSLTDATPETRLLLMVWAARLGFDYQVGTREALANALSTSKRSLGIALEYLEQEGYLWKIRSPSERLKTDKSKVRFDYALTRECRNLWSKDYKTCVWKDELIAILKGKSVLDGLPADKSSKLTINARLVWVVFLMQSNNARYVVGMDDLSLCKLTGMTVTALRRAINELVRKGVIAVEANGVKRNGLFPDLAPIYKMQRQQPETKLVKLGVALEYRRIVPLRCISQLITYHNYVNKRRNQKFANKEFPSQISVLSNEQYFELAEVLSGKKFITWIHHLCLSNILSLVPVYAFAQTESNKPERVVQAEIEKQLYFLLSQALRGSQPIFGFTPILRNKQDIDPTKEQLEPLKHYLFNAVIEESFGIIQELAIHWKLFVECMGSDGRIVGYNFKERMISINRQTEAEELELSDAVTEDSNTQSNLALSVSCVLTVMVPNTESYGDSMVHGGQLLTQNAKLKHPSVEHVEQLIIGTSKGLF